MVGVKRLLALTFALAFVSASKMNAERLPAGESAIESYAKRVDELTSSNIRFQAELSDLLSDQLTFQARNHITDTIGLEKGQGHDLAYTDEQRAKLSAAYLARYEAAVAKLEVQRNEIEGFLLQEGFLGLSGYAHSTRAIESYFSTLRPLVSVYLSLRDTQGFSSDALQDWVKKRFALQIPTAAYESLGLGFSTYKTEETSGAQLTPYEMSMGSRSMADDTSTMRLHLSAAALLGLEVKLLMQLPTQKNFLTLTRFLAIRQQIQRGFDLAYYTRDWAKRVGKDGLPAFDAASILPYAAPLSKDFATWDFARAFATELSHNSRESMVRRVLTGSIMRFGAELPSLSKLGTAEEVGKLLGFVPELNKRFTEVFQDKNFPEPSITPKAFLEITEPQERFPRAIAEVFLKRSQAQSLSRLLFDDNNREEQLMRLWKMIVLIKMDLHKEAYIATLEKVIPADDQDIENMSFGDFWGEFEHRPGIARTREAYLASFPQAKPVLEKMLDDFNTRLAEVYKTERADFIKTILKAATQANIDEVAFSRVAYTKPVRMNALYHGLAPDIARLKPSAQGWRLVGCLFNLPSYQNICTKKLETWEDKRAYHARVLSDLARVKPDRGAFFSEHFVSVILDPTKDPRGASLQGHSSKNIDPERAASVRLLVELGRLMKFYSSAFDKESPSAHDILSSAGLQLYKEAVKDKEVFTAMPLLRTLIKPQGHQRRVELYKALLEVTGNAEASEELIDRAIVQARKGTERQIKVALDATTVHDVENIINSGAYAESIESYFAEFKDAQIRARGDTQIPKTVGGQFMKYVVERNAHAATFVFMGHMSLGMGALASHLLLLQRTHAVTMMMFEGFSSTIGLLFNATSSLFAVRSTYLYLEHRHFKRMAENTRDLFVSQVAKRLQFVGSRDIDQWTEKSDQALSEAKMTALFDGPFSFWMAAHYGQMRMARTRLQGVERAIDDQLALGLLPGSPASWKVETIKEAYNKAIQNTSLTASQKAALKQSRANLLEDAHYGRTWTADGLFKEEGKTAVGYDRKVVEANDSLLSWMGQQELQRIHQEKFLNNKELMKRLQAEKENAEAAK